MTSMRTHKHNDINASLTDQRVTLCGWTHRRRDHGGVIFIDLRDRSGLVQIVCHPEQAQVFELAEQCRNEFVLKIDGVVSPRPEGTINPNLASGEVEVVVESLEILNRAKPLPFAIDEEESKSGDSDRNTTISEAVRLQHRYLDLRRPIMVKRMMRRGAISKYLRRYLEERGFVDIETPFLTKSTPEGARDYLVPSRVHQGEFYALPQSPQIFKQLLMVAGFERYYQIVKCFRDEDLRADRQPEFTQVDIEMSFVNEEDVMSTMEDMIRGCFKQVLDVTLADPFPRMTYAESMRLYGNDRPDLRVPLHLVDIADLMQDVDFKVFREPAKRDDSRVVVMRVPKGAEMSRKVIDDYTKYISNYGAKGLAYIKVNALENGMNGLQSPILKFLPDATVQQIIERSEAQNGDCLFFGADKTKIVNDAMGALRVKLGEDLNLLEGEWRPLWVTDFPMFEQDEETGKWQALHHPFTAPQLNDPEKLRANPGCSLSRAYDIVINGYEVGGGSIRIHDIDLQRAAFEILGIDQQEAADKFSHLMEGLQSGCPPHGGIAFGLDRLAMLMCKCKSIRDVIAFPKTQTAHCPLTHAPSEVSENQLKDCGLRVRSSVLKNKEDSQQQSKE